MAIFGRFEAVLTETEPRFEGIETFWSLLNFNSFICGTETEPRFEGIETQ